MSYILDTNICSAHMRRPGGVAHRFVQYSGRLAISTITLAELSAGACMGKNPDALLAAIDDLLNDVEALPFDIAAAREFGRLRGLLKPLGIVVNPVDLLISAVALSMDRTLVTHNTRHFKNIPDLRLEDWLRN